MKEFADKIEACTETIQKAIARPQNRFLRPNDLAVINQLLKLMSEIRNAESNLVTSKLREAINTVLDQLVKSLKELESFDQAKSETLQEAETRWNRLFVQLESLLDQLHGYTVRLLAFDQSALTNKQRLAELADRAEANSGRTEVAVKTIEEASGHTGNLQVGQHFEDAKKYYQRVAVACSLAAAALMGLTIHMAFDLVTPSFAKDWIDIIDHYLPKVIPIGLLVTGVVYSLKSYQAAMHNAVLYHQRETLFKTLDLYVQSMPEKDDESRRRILMRIIDTASDIQLTGYLSGQTDTPHKSKITEFVEAVKEAKK